MPLCRWMEYKERCEDLLALWSPLGIAQRALTVSTCSVSTADVVHPSGCFSCWAQLLPTPLINSAIGIGQSRYCFCHA